MPGPRRLSIRLSMIVSMSIGPPVGAFVVLICSGAPDNVFASVNPMYYSELSTVTQAFTRPILYSSRLTRMRSSFKIDYLSCIY